MDEKINAQIRKGLDFLETSGFSGDVVNELNRLFELKTNLSNIDMHNVGPMHKMINHNEETENNYMSWIQEELEGAKKYYEEYNKTRYLQFLEMADDELSHAEKLINLAFNQSRDPKSISAIDKLSKEKEFLKEKIKKKK